MLCPLISCVAQAQRDYVQAQIAEVQAKVAHLKALVDLYRLDGSLLDQRGIAAPGKD
jgi:outer membrane protein